MQNLRELKHDRYLQFFNQMGWCTDIFNKEITSSHESVLDYMIEECDNPLMSDIVRELGTNDVEHYNHMRNYINLRLKGESATDTNLIYICKLNKIYIKSIKSCLDAGIDGQLLVDTVDLEPNNYFYILSRLKTTTVDEVTRILKYINLYNKTSRQFLLNEAKFDTLEEFQTQMGYPTEDKLNTYKRDYAGITLLHDIIRFSEKLTKFNAYHYIKEIHGKMTKISLYGCMRWQSIYRDFEDKGLNFETLYDTVDELEELINNIPLTSELLMEIARRNIDIKPYLHLNLDGQKLGEIFKSLIN